MKFRSFYLFYLLTIFLILFGIIMKDKTFVRSGWETVIYNGFWFYIIPMAVLCLITGATYNYLSYTNRNAKTVVIIVHFAIYVAGFFYTLFHLLP